MRYLTWKQIQARLEIFWDVYPTEASWKELRQIFLQCVVEERNHSRRYVKKGYHMTYPAYIREQISKRKPDLDYYDNRADRWGQYRGKLGDWRNNESWS